MLFQSISKSITETFKTPKGTIILTFSHYHQDQVTIGDSKNPKPLFVYGFEHDQTAIRTNLGYGETLSPETKCYNPTTQMEKLFSEYTAVDPEFKPEIIILEMNPDLGIDTKTWSYYWSNLVSKASDCVSGSNTVGRDLTLDVFRNGKTGIHANNMLSAQGYDFLYSFSWGSVVETLGHTEIPEGIEKSIAIQSKIATLSGKKPGNLLELAGLSDLVTVNVNPTKSAADTDETTDTDKTTDTDETITTITVTSEPA